MSMRTRPLFVTAISILVCGAIATPAVAASGRATAGHVPTTVAAEPFATTVETLGSTRFQEGYGGQGVSPSGYPVVYVVAGHGAGFLSALRGEAASAGGADYAVAYVPHSWAQLNSLTMRIASQEKTWRQRGIELAKWGADPASSKVTIHLRSYSAAAGRALLAAYGSGWVSVSRQPMTQQVVFLDRYFDHAPWYGGDAIFPNAGNPGVYCTDAFTMLGNAHPNNHWLLTAGHCGTHHPWYTNFNSLYQIGGTGTDYFHGYGGNTATDTQTIGPTNAWGDVWGNSTVVYHPIGKLHPGSGSLITFDGARTGAVFGAEVTNAGPFCLVVQGITDCNLGRADDFSSVICQPGDSGGPVFQRTSSGNNIYAVGTISAGSSDGKTCYYTLIGSIESTTNTHLDTNATG